MSDEVETYLAEHAPELDPDEVRQFIAENEKPDSEPGTVVEWATRAIRWRQRDVEEEHPALEIVEEEMRRHDERHE